MDDVQKINEVSGGQVAQNIEGDQIYKQINITKSNTNKEIKKIKKDFFDVRLKLIPFVSKVLLVFNVILLIVAIIGFKLLQTDFFYNLLTSSLMALMLLSVYHFFNKAYYKELKQKNKVKSKSDKFTVLALIDIVVFSCLFWIYS